MRGWGMGQGQRVCGEHREQRSGPQTRRIRWRREGARARTYRGKSVRRAEPERECDGGEERGTDPRASELLNLLPRQTIARPSASPSPPLHLSRVPSAYLCTAPHLLHLPHVSPLLHSTSLPLVLPPVLLTPPHCTPPLLHVAVSYPLHFLPPFRIAFPSAPPASSLHVSLSSLLSPRPLVLRSLSFPSPVFLAASSLCVSPPFFSRPPASLPYLPLPASPRPASSPCPCPPSSCNVPSLLPPSP
ncbi:hypothetical protein B0H11DRAFT_262340 [Mycena galericulata]|nr:hypothetical protein B0H11DRAFT_262340 [Mycena galericulata]